LTTKMCIAFLLDAQQRGNLLRCAILAGDCRVAALPATTE
jgi:hypothetical protein